MARTLGAECTVAGACPMLSSEHEASYTSNSAPQNLALLLCRPTLEKAIAEQQASIRMKQKTSDCWAEGLRKSRNFSEDDDAVKEVFCVADMGCASGPNCWRNMQFMIDCIRKYRRMESDTVSETGNGDHVCSSPIQFFLCDLPSNDFNGLLLEQQKYMEGYEQCFPAVVAGNFHGRLFPPSSLHLVFSSTSVHWLSESPDLSSDPDTMRVMRKKIWVDGSYMYKDAKKVYAERWRHEFTSFLTCRKTEMANGGMMFLLIMSSDEARPNQLQGSCFQMLEESWIQLVEQGTLQSWQLETFNIPWHFPTLMELESAINGVSDLRIQQIRAMHTYVGDTYWKQWSNDPDELARRLTNFYRSIVSNVIEKHVGPMNCELIFTRFNDLLEKNLRSRSTWDPYWIYPWDHHAMVEITKEQ